MSLSSKVRREQILAQAYEQGHVDVKSIALRMSVSDATIRRDLRRLADDNLLELVYGGANLPRNTDLSFRGKALRNVESKRRIGRLAAQLVRDDEQLFIDSGTTAFEVCPHLRLKRGISVIVNSVRVAAELGGLKDLDVIVLGGQYRSERMDMVGPLAIGMLEQLRGYLAFIGADGISRDFGVTASDIESAHLYRLAIRNARETILLVDQSKFASPSLYKISDLDSVSRVITDQPPTPEWMQYFAEHGIEVIYPHSEGTLLPADN
jgi:DeoR family transcriptional regulator of aga operon